MGAIMLGSISLKIIFILGIPRHNAESIYCSLRTLYVVALVSLANPGMKMIPIASIAFIMFVPRFAIRIIASSMAGKQKTTSMNLISKKSTNQPLKAEITPIITPPTAPIKTEMNPTVIEILAA